MPAPYSNFSLLLQLPPPHHPFRVNFQGSLLTFTLPPISLFCIWGNRGLGKSRSRYCFYYTNGVKTFLKQQSCPPLCPPPHPPFLLSELAALLEWWRPRELEPRSLAFQPKPSVGPCLSRFESLMSDPPHPLPNHTPGQWEKQGSSTNGALDVITAGRYHFLLQEVGDSAPLPNMIKTGQEQN